MLTFLRLQGGWDAARDMPGSPAQADAFKQLKVKHRDVRAVEDRFTRSSQVGIWDLRENVAAMAVAENPSRPSRTWDIGRRATERLEGAIARHTAPSVAAVEQSEQSEQSEQGAWGWVVNPLGTPMQVNGSDCGVCMLETIRAVISSAPDQQPAFQYSGIGVRDVCRRKQSVELWEGVVRLPWSSKLGTACIQHLKVRAQHKPSPSPPGSSVQDVTPVTVQGGVIVLNSTPTSAPAAEQPDSVPTASGATPNPGARGGASDGDATPVLTASKRNEHHPGTPVKQGGKDPLVPVKGSVDADKGVLCWRAPCM